MRYSTLALPVRFEEAVQVEVERRFEAAHHVSRAVLREALRRLDLCREAKDWQLASQLPDVAERRTLYRTVTDRYGLDEYSLLKYAGRVRNSAPQLKDHLGNVEAQALAKRVWRSISRHLHGDSQGKTFGRPHVPHRDKFVCLSSESGHRQGLVLRGAYQAGPHTKDQLVKRQKRSDDPSFVEVPLYFQWNVGHGVRRRLVIPIHASRSGVQAARHAYYLSDLSKIVDLQLVRTQVRGRWQYSLHVKVEKKAYRPTGRYGHVPDARVGVDLGPQRLALVTDGPTPLVRLYTPSKVDREQERQAKRVLRRQQRAQERSRRATNSHAYNGKSRKRDAKLTITSNAYKERRSRMREAERRRAAEARRQESEIAKHVVTHGGRHVVTEDLAIAPWARLWGSSVRRFSPARFLQTIEREAALAGGTVRRVSPWSSALSSTCICGAREKKPLSQRRHTCDSCGLGNDMVLDRDLFSAYLCLHLKAAIDQVDASQAQAAWAGAEGLLGMAASTPTSKHFGALGGSTQQEPRKGNSKPVSSSKLESHVYSTDVVAHRRGLSDGVQGATAESFADAPPPRE